MVFGLVFFSGTGQCLHGENGVWCPTGYPEAGAGVPPVFTCSCEWLKSYPQVLKDTTSGDSQELCLGGIFWLGELIILGLLWVERGLVWPWKLQVVGVQWYWGAAGGEIPVGNWPQSPIFFPHKGLDWPQGLLKSLTWLSMQELSQLQTVVGNTDVILSMDNHRDLNLDGIIEEVRQEYEGIAHRSTAEVDAMYRGRVSGHQANRNRDLLVGKETKNVLCPLPISTRTCRTCGQINESSCGTVTRKSRNLPGRSKGSSQKLKSQGKG